MTTILRKRLGTIVQLDNSPDGTYDLRDAELDPRGDGAITVGADWQNCSHRATFKDLTSRDECAVYNLVGPITNIYACGW